MPPKGKKKGKAAPPPSTTITSPPPPVNTATTISPPKPSSSTIASQPARPRNAATLPSYPPNSIGSHLQAVRAASRPASAAYAAYGYSVLTAAQKEALPFEILLDSRPGFRALDPNEEGKFWAKIEDLGLGYTGKGGGKRKADKSQKGKKDTEKEKEIETEDSWNGLGAFGLGIRNPDTLGIDWSGRRIAEYSIDEYRKYEGEQRKLRQLERESSGFSVRFEKQRKRIARERELQLREARVESQDGNSAIAAPLIPDFEAPFSDADIEIFVSGTEGNEREALIAEWKADREEQEKSKVVSDTEVKEEKGRRIDMATLRHQRYVGRYAGDPEWDDVVPLPQEEGEDALAKIAYSDEYAEAISYLRALTLTQEHSPRALALTTHIISLNPAHYTVWLYRFSILTSPSHSPLSPTPSTVPKPLETIPAELAWLNETALSNPKNYQIWQHRQLLITHLYPAIGNDRAKELELASRECAFMDEMFEGDAKNYHVWSYRAWLVRKLNLFPSQVQEPATPTPTDHASAPESIIRGLNLEPPKKADELTTTANLLQQDIRNNSAWSHRFFLVFSDPAYITPGTRATQADPKIPPEIFAREIEFAREGIRKAPESGAGWGYLKGIIKKSGDSLGGLASLENFAGEFVDLTEENGRETIRSTHALDLLADIWAARGEKEKARRAWGLLAGKYDRVRKKYWEWKIGGMDDAGEKVVEKTEI